MSQVFNNFAKQKKSLAVLLKNYRGFFLSTGVGNSVAGLSALTIGTFAEAPHKLLLAFKLDSAFGLASAATAGLCYASELDKVKTAFKEFNLRAAIISPLIWGSVAVTTAALISTQGIDEQTVQTDIDAPVLAITPPKP